MSDLQQIKIDRIRKILQDLCGTEYDFDDEIIAILETRMESVGLRETLRRYGQHDDTCSRRQIGVLSADPECDCGLDAILAATPAAAAEGLGQGAMDVVNERERQIRVEGWTAEHDDLFTDGELAMAGAAYVISAEGGIVDGSVPRPPLEWPWDEEWWKPKDRRSNFVRAAALLIAEIDRLDRCGVALASPAAPVEGELRTVVHADWCKHGPELMSVHGGYIRHPNYSCTCDKVHARECEK